MSKLQFWILNGTALVLVGLLWGHFFFSRHNERLNSTLNQERAVLNKSRQVGTVLDQLAKRIAIGSEKDPRLKEVLLKYGLSVTLEVDGKKKNYP